MLNDATLPAAFRSADLASQAGQRQAVLQVQWSLWLGIVAAATGAVSWRVGDSDLDILAAIGGSAFVGALVFALRLGAAGSEARWYRGRAIAESVKTLAWRYTVCGDPFGSASESDVNERFVQRVNEVIARGHGVQLAPVSGEQITESMKELRAQSLPDRRDAYIRDRVDNQESWYTTKAQGNENSAHAWSALVITMNLVGIAGALCRFAGWVDIDLLGVAAAAAGGATAWSQLRQNRVLATSYALAAQELSLVREKLKEVTDERGWALAVSDAEEAISREHTMWLARHGHAPT